jgi:hypothetical protein
LLQGIEGKNYKIYRQELQRYTIVVFVTIN